MSITSALNSAISGLNATSRQAEVVSNNIANATSPGYGLRSVGLASLSLGGSGSGVKVVGIQRHADLYLINDRRGAQAGTGNSAVRAEYLKRLEGIIGEPGDAYSLSGRLQKLDQTLLSAASSPESELRLSEAVSAAVDLVNGVRQASKSVQLERLRADREIATVVSTLNTNLAEVEELNRLITTFNGSGRDASALLDRRQYIIDDIASLIPLKEIPRQDGQVALISTHGAVLLEGKASIFGFAGVNNMVAEMSVGSGSLSGLTLNGQTISTSGSSSLIFGGELGGLFYVRDEISTDIQTMLDSFAAELIVRFSDSGLDPTLGAGSPGIFTDNGSIYDSTNEVGVASRITVNSLLDPSRGGDITLLRDGLGAVSSGPVGEARLISSIAARLNEATSTQSASFSGNKSMPGLAADILSRVSALRVSYESEQSYSVSRLTTLSDLERRNGVDVDVEMQNLLIIEKNYAANAKVIQAVDEMIKILLGI